MNETLLLFHAARRLARLGNSMQNCHLWKGPDVTCFAAASNAAGCVEVGDFGALLEMTGLRGYQTLASRGLHFTKVRHAALL